VGEKAYVEGMTEKRMGRGADEKEIRDFLTRWATTYPAMEKGELAVVDPLLKELVGRELRRMRDVLVEKLGGEEGTVKTYAK
jgi:hypothetical protein